MDIKHSFEKLKSVFTSDKKLAVLCAVGVLGVVLLILSEFIPSGEKKAEKKESVTAAQSQETYAEDIEKRLTEIVSSRDSLFYRRSGKNARYGDSRERRRAGICEE